MITVILADDLPVVRDGLCFLLNSQSDIKVVGTADNGREAVQLATKLNPDVVVLDIAMPLLNGIDAAQEIRSACPHTSVIVFSIHYTTLHIQRALQAGVTGYLLKESAGDEIVEAIRTVHEGRRYLSRKIAETVVDDYVRQGGTEVAQTSPPLKVFLCHAHADANRVRDLYKRLRRAGIDAWLDKEKLFPGANWDSEIRKAVRETDAVIVCLSKQFTADGYRQKEVKIALETAMEKQENTIFIIPARLEECEVMESLIKWHKVDLFEENGWSNLIRALKHRADSIGATVGRRRPTQLDIDELEKLSPRERQVFQLIAEGKSSSEAAQILHLSVKNIETYRSRFMHTLGLKDMAALVKFAIQHGIISLEK